MSKRNLDFLYEMGALRQMPRNWDRFFSGKMANNSEHTFRVLWIALVIAKNEKTENIEKIMKMALVHDVVESRSCDVDYLSRQYVERNEELAIEDMLNDTSLEEFVDVWKEYQKRECIEAKIVKDADNLDIDLELMEQADSSSSVVDYFSKMRKEVLYPKLYTETAKKMWKDVYDSNVHDWHQKGRNRANNGDWTEKKE